MAGTLLLAAPIADEGSRPGHIHETVAASIAEALAWQKAGLKPLLRYCPVCKRIPTGLGTR